MKESQTYEQEWRRAQDKQNEAKRAQIDQTTLRSAGEGLLRDEAAGDVVHHVVELAFAKHKVTVVDDSGNGCCHYSRSFDFTNFSPRNQNASHTFSPINVSMSEPVAPVVSKFLKVCRLERFTMSMAR